jgi:hypothetical protein
MTRLYSSSGKGFFDPEIHGEKIPKDAVEIEDADYKALFEAQSEGKIIDAGPDGKPIARELNDEELGSGRKTARDLLLGETDWLVARHRDELETEEGTTLSPEQYIALQKWRCTLRDITEHPDFPRVQFPPRPAGV